MRLIAVLTFAVLLTAPLYSCSSSTGEHIDEEAEVNEYISDTDFLFDTVVTLSINGTQDQLQQAMERCQYFEGIFSRTVEGSDIWRINEADGAPVEVSQETADIITKALDYCEASGGLFDITIGSVSSLWDFKEGVRPSDDEIAEAIKHVDYKGVHVDGTTVWLDDPYAKLDLGGIAKGYISDDLKEYLTEIGVESACLNLGGNVALLGSKVDGSSWNVGIQDPNGEDQEVIATISKSGGTVVTSGLYERQFIQDDELYYHILDPRTGYPVKSDLVSVSLSTESSTDADAYATMLFLLGHDKALSLIENDDRFEGLLVDDDGKITLSNGASFELL